MNPARLVPHQRHLRRPVSARRDGIAAGAGASKSKIVPQARSAWLGGNGAGPIDLGFPHRLDGTSTGIAPIERNTPIELASLALFVRDSLAVNAPAANGGEAARAIGHDRFAAFAERTGQQLASSRRTVVPEEAR